MYFIGQIFTSIYRNKSITHVGEVQRTIEEKILEHMKILQPEIFLTRLTLVDTYLCKYLLNVHC